MSDREAPEGGWGLNIGAFERRYSAWRVESPDGIHLTARRKVNGRPRGPRVQGRNLDELARKIEEVVHWQPGKEGRGLEGTPAGDARFTYIKYD